MAKITNTEKNTYQERINSYVSMTKALLKTEKDLLLESRHSTPDAPLKKLTLVDEMINLASNYLAINGVSQVVLKGKNEESLDNARKSLYKAVMYLEEAVSNYIDAPFSDYEDKLAIIESFDENQRYQLVRKIGLAIDMLEQAYGDNSKWKWTFVELEGRFATVTKNLLDLRNIIVNSSSQSPFYDSTVYHLRLVKKLLTQTADRYREKYELSTSEIQDFKTGINFLGALRRMHVVLSESEDAEMIKKKYAVWKAKLETDIKKQEEAKKNRA